MEKWIQVASLVAQATSEVALKPVLNGPYWSLAVSRWTEETEYNDFLWRRISFLSPTYEETWEPVTEEEIRREQKRELENNPGRRDKEKLHLS